MRDSRRRQPASPVERRTPSQPKAHSTSARLDIPISFGRGYFADLSHSASISWHGMNLDEGRCFQSALLVACKESKPINTRLSFLSINQIRVLSSKRFVIN